MKQPEYDKLLIKLSKDSLKNGFVKLETKEMKLELKHLAAYLPYGLKTDKGLFWAICRTPLIKTKLEDGEIVKGTIESIKPILLPLSDLTKEENSDIWAYVLQDDSYDLSTICEFKCDISNQLMYVVFDALVKCHFDVFGLIPKGLAINKNTIN